MIWLLFGALASAFGSGFNVGVCLFYPHGAADVGYALVAVAFSVFFVYLLLKEIMSE